MGHGVRGGSAHLGFKESPTVVPDLGSLPAVGRNAHGCGPCVSNVASDCQVLILGPVLYSDVHCRLAQGRNSHSGEGPVNLEISCREGRLRGKGWGDLACFTLPPFSQYVCFTAFLLTDLRPLSTEVTLYNNLYYTFLKNALLEGEEGIVSSTGMPCGKGWCGVLDLRSFIQEALCPSCAGGRRGRAGRQDTAHPPGSHNHPANAAVLTHAVWAMAKCHMPALGGLETPR